MAAIKDQAIASGAEWTEGVVEAITQIDNVFSVLLADGKELVAKHLVIATNLQTRLLENLGFELAVNEKVPSGKIKKVLGIEPDGTTNLPNLYITSLLADFQANLSSLPDMAHQWESL
jgi:thioredoxin reductase (NADPH)